MKTHAKVRGLVALALLAAAATASAAMPGRTHADTSPPPDWTAEDWNALSAADQGLEMSDYPAGTSDPATKAPWVANNADTTYDAALDSEMNADGPGVALTTGMTESAISPFSDSQYIFQNGWQDLDAAGTTLIQVWAGAATSDPCGGVIVVNRVAWPQADGASPIGDVTVMPGDNTGPLVLSYASGHALDVISAGGSRGTYNVDTGGMKWWATGALPGDGFSCAEYDGISYPDN